MSVVKLFSKFWDDPIVFEVVPIEPIHMQMLYLTKNNLIKQEGEKNNCEKMNLGQDFGTAI